MKKNRKILTSGDVAEFCDVSLRTAIRWIENKRLKAYKLPGRGDNRIKVDDFLDFLQEYGMPIPEEFQKQKRVLVVDDDPLITKTISKVLKKHGFDVKIVTDSFEAGIQLMSFKPDVMTLDLMMPGVSGFDVIETTRNNKELDQVRILVISSSDESELKKAIELGADAYLNKPIHERSFLKTFHDLLGQRASQ